MTAKQESVTQEKGADKICASMLYENSKIRRKVLFFWTGQSPVTTRFALLHGQGQHISVRCTACGRSRRSNL